MWQWDNATASAVAGFSTVAVMHPLDVVRTRFQVYDGKGSSLLTYKNTVNAIFTIARMEGFRGLYAGFSPAVLGQLFLGSFKHILTHGKKDLSSGLHLISAAEAGALVCFCTNPVWLVKTRMQLNPLHQARPYSGLYAVSLGAIQFTVYEELRKVISNSESRGIRVDAQSSGELLNSIDYAVLGGSSKIAAMLLTYPFQVVRARLQQRSGNDGIPRYKDSFHVLKETARFECIRWFYRGITPNLLKNVPAASITFIVYENVLSLLKLTRQRE